MGWVQRQDGHTPKLDFVNEQRWQLFFIANPPPRWVVADLNAITITTNGNLTEDDIEPAKTWADREIASYRKAHPNQIGSFLAGPPKP